MSRLPIRLRVAAGFAVAMGVVLAGTGVFLYTRLSEDLGAALDQQLQLRAQDLSELARDPRGSLSEEHTRRFIETGESFAQLLGADGRVLDATAALRASPLLDAQQRARALRVPLYASLPRLPNLDEGVRLLATPVQRAGRPVVLVVGATAENRRETLASLREELLIVGPVALLLATALGYMLAGVGLRAVDAMRARAAQISSDRPGERLPVPPSGDELERLGATLNQMLARLQDGIERERTFVAEAGHELRTPLALMRAELDYALHYAAGEDELRAALRTASDETDRVVALAGALLLMASSDQGQLRLRVELVAVEELLASVCQRFAWRAEQLGRSLKVASADASLTIQGDRLRLEQALGNLVDNALRYGGGTVRLQARADSDRVLLSVADEGAGFDQGFLPHAFQRFSRDQGARGGSGLGLAIVLAIAEAHGGSAIVLNTERGAEVSIQVPRTPPAQGAAPAAAPGAAETVPPAGDSS
jgi:two-component system, OmpR family, sensor kinase